MMRSPLFWVIAVFLGFAFVTQAGAIIFEGAGDPPDWYRTGYLEAAGAFLFIFGAVLGLWRGTSTAPPASLADVVLMMGSPIPTRLQFLAIAAKATLSNVLIISAWAVFGAGGLAASSGDPLLSTRLFIAVALLVLLSESIRFAVWLLIDRSATSSPNAARRLGRVVRVAAMLIVAIALAVVASPFPNRGLGNWQDILSLIAERGELLASVPPMSLLAGILTPDDQTGISVIGMLLLTGTVATIALVSARDFAEPIAIAAERKTDPRGQLLESGSDIQWAALSQHGVTPRMRVTLPPFGQGAWALLWGGMVRWVRYQLAAVWLTALILVPIGILAGIAIRYGVLPVQIGWAIALMMPFFGSINMFMDELRRQFIYLVPGSNWIRLIAGSLSSMLDGLLAGTLISITLLITGGLPIDQAAGLIFLSAALSILAQASMAITQLLLPYWVGHSVRVSTTMSVTMVVSLPGIVALVLLTTTTGALTGMLVAGSIFLLTGLVAFVVAGLLFDRLEFSG